MDQQYIDKVLPFNVQYALSHLLEESRDMRRSDASKASDVAVKKHPEFIRTLAEEANRYEKVASTLDDIADRLESLGMLKEAYDLDVVSNTLERSSMLESVKLERDAFLTNLPDRYKSENLRVTTHNKDIHLRHDIDTDDGVYVLITRVKMFGDFVRMDYSLVKKDEHTDSFSELTHINQQAVMPHVLEDFRVWAEDNGHTKYYDYLSGLKLQKAAEEIFSDSSRLPNNVREKLLEIADTYKAGQGNWPKVRHKVNPTINKNAVFKVLQVVAIDLVAGTKKLLESGVDKIDGFVIDAKRDYRKSEGSAEDDWRRKNMYRYMVNKISEHSNELFGRPLPRYTIKQEDSTDYFIFDTPLEPTTKTASHGADEKVAGQNNVDVLYVVHPETILEQWHAIEYVRPFINKLKSKIQSFPGPVIVARVDNVYAKRNMFTIKEDHQGFDYVDNFLNSLHGDNITVVTEAREGLHSKPSLGLLAGKVLDDLYLEGKLGKIIVVGCFKGFKGCPMCIEDTVRTLSREYGAEHVDTDDSLILTAGLVDRSKIEGEEVPRVAKALRVAAKFLNKTAGNSQRKVFVDLNEVLVDFFAPTPGKPKTREETSKIMQSMDEETYAGRIPWAPQGQQLWGVIKKYHPYVLSMSGKDHWESLGEYRFTPYIRKVKELWVSKNLPESSGVLHAQNKGVYAIHNGIPAVLIDNTPSKIESWERAGGIGILYRGNPAEVAQALEDIMGNQSKTASKIVLA